MGDEGHVTVARPLIARPSHAITSTATLPTLDQDEELV